MTSTEYDRAENHPPVWNQYSLLKQVLYSLIMTADKAAFAAGVT